MDESSSHCHSFASWSLFPRCCFRFGRGCFPWVQRCDKKAAHCNQSLRLQP
uniref:Uncharacterized protein n=1 Tax=Anguilla anguilla TaxID=7936 RepID=A0A0E9TNY2_ANGAN